MNIKKSIFVIILAVVLAFFVVKLINKTAKQPTENPQVEQAEFIETKQEDALILQREEEIVTKTPVIKKEEVLPIIKPVFHPEEETKAEEIVPNEIENSDVVKEIDSSVVVITREYKFKSPDKYSFK